jgi:uncharacterized membrane protein YsdA (DUF1294 family)
MKDQFTIFLLYSIDKYKSKVDKIRIPEKYFLLLTILGGSFGSFLGMIFNIHKTRKIKFWFIIIISIFIQTYLLKIIIKITNSNLIINLIKLLENLYFEILNHK